MSFSRKFAVYFQNTLGGYFCIGFEINRPWITKVLSIKEQSSSGFLRKSYYSRSSHRRCFVRKGVLRNLAKSTGKPLRQSLFLNKVAGRKVFFNKVAGLRPATLLKKRLWRRCFPVDIAKFLRAPFWQNTSGWLLLLWKISWDW